MFNNPEALYGVAIKSFLESATDGLLFVVDNSPVALESEFFFHERVKYIFNGENLGFGKAHNKAILNLPSTSEFHLFLNPDISFGQRMIPDLHSYCDKDPSIGVLMPRINYPDGSGQRLAKLLPTPVDLIIRRFVPIKAVKSWIDQRYELHDLPQHDPVDVPNLSGCCLFVRTKLLRDLGGFDERYFMYLEDVDLVRRIGDHARTTYVPTVTVVHEYAKGSYRWNRLLYYHLKSAIQYFTKWGWLIDSVRSERNNKMLDLIANLSSK